MRYTTDWPLSTVSSLSIPYHTSGGGFAGGVVGPVRFVWQLVSLAVSSYLQNQQQICRFCGLSISVHDYQSNGFGCIFGDIYIMIAISWSGGRSLAASATAMHPSTPCAAWPKTAPASASTRRRPCCGPAGPSCWAARRRRRAGLRRRSLRCWAGCMVRMTCWGDGGEWWEGWGGQMLVSHGVSQYLGETSVMHCSFNEKNDKQPWDLKGLHLYSETSCKWRCIQSAHPGVKW